MLKRQKIFPNMYRDSVALMQISAQLAEASGIHQASLVMATEANLELLRDAGLIDSSPDAGVNDLLLAVEADSDDAVDEAITATETALTQSKAAAGGGGPAEEPPHSIEMALDETPAADLALISCPGEYAAAEAMKALRLGLDVMLFSDNVSVEEEIALKTFADARDLMVMGPDCGTAIINGVPLGFANVVRPGAIGIVAASGTGLQQVACLVDKWGGGLSQAIGTGGRDLHALIGGRTMIKGIEALAQDDGTEVIVLISKPPAADVAARVIEVASTAGKPVVVNFLGAPSGDSSGNIHPAADLESAAHLAMTLANGDQALPELPRHGMTESQVTDLAAGLKVSQSYVRGLYSGGTFSYEAMLLLEQQLGPIHSASPLSPAHKLNDVWQSAQHTVIDLGDDVFTRGRPHPMIDHRLRNDRILQEANDPETAVILLDVVLGYGAHDDPAGEMADVLHQAAAVDTPPVLIGFICGTEGDPQNAGRQAKMLQDAGMILADSNAQAVRLAGDIVSAAGGSQ